MVPGDEGKGLGVVRHHRQGLSVEANGGSWLGQSLDGETDLHGYILQIPISYPCMAMSWIMKLSSAPESTKKDAETDSKPQRSVHGRVKRDGTELEALTNTPTRVDRPRSPGWVRQSATK